MTAPVIENQQTNNDKEINFRKQEQAIREKYERELAQERHARMEAEKKYQEAAAPKHDDSDDNYSEPYVDDKRLNKKLGQFGKEQQTEISKAMAYAKEAAKEELKQELWLDDHSDFHEILQHADKFAAKHPQLANTILRMPEGFERQKLVYENIKSLGIDKPEVVKSSGIQEKIDNNRRSPYYQPSGVGSPPITSQGDFSVAGQKQAYEKMQQLKANLRL